MKGPTEISANPKPYQKQAFSVNRNERSFTLSNPDGKDGVKRILKFF
jgi:hypothetical protein